MVCSPTIGWWVWGGSNVYFILILLKLSNNKHPLTHCWWSNHPLVAIGWWLGGWDASKVTPPNVFLKSRQLEFCRHCYDDCHDFYDGDDNFDHDFDGDFGDNFDDVLLTTMIL